MRVILMENNLNSSVSRIKGGTTACLVMAEVKGFTTELLISLLENMRAAG